MKKQVTRAAIVSAAMLFGGYVWGRAGVTVSISGKPATSDVLERDGKVYVPLTDMAKAFDHAIVRTGDAYDLVPVGGTKPKDGVKAAKGLIGAVGETLGNGQVSVQVLQVIRGERYVSAITGKTFDAEPDSDLVAVVCRMRNTLKKLRQYDLGYFKGGDTALTDADGKSFAPKQWDRKEPIARLQAGAGTDFAVIFAVPKAVRLDSFIYAVRPNDFDQTMRRDNFRVSLAKKEDTESTEK